MLDHEEEAHAMWQSNKTEGVWVPDTKEALLALSHLPALLCEAETEFYFKKGLSGEGGHWSDSIFPGAKQASSFIYWPTFKTQEISHKTLDFYNSSWNIRSFWNPGTVFLLPTCPFLWACGTFQTLHPHAPGLRLLSCCCSAEMIDGMAAKELPTLDTTGV